MSCKIITFGAILMLKTHKEVVVPEPGMLFHTNNDTASTPTSSYILNLNETMTTIKKSNPYNGKVYEVVVPEPGMQLHPNAIIIIEDGKQRMISRTGLAMKLNAGGGWYNPEYFRND